MTVAELTEILNTMDPKSRVVVNGYEGGLEDIKRDQITAIRLKLNARKENLYVGNHEEALDSETFDCMAVLISRYAA